MRTDGNGRRMVLAAAMSTAMALAAGCGSSSSSSTGAASGATPGTAASPTVPATTVPTTTGPATTPPPATTTQPDGSAGSSDWPTYHATTARTAAVAALPSGAVSVRWRADLGGKVYGQVLAAGGRLFAATETNRVVALDPHTGGVLWSTTIGAPLTDVASVVGCGNIDPLGVTSTPVIDTASGTIFAVGEVSTGRGAVHHQLVGLDVATGSVKLSEPVDPPLPSGERTASLLQRASLALANGRVYVAYGGHYGDCGSYHGWVVGVDETGAASPVSFEVAADGHGGAIWQSGGAPAVDAAGDVYVTTGNANPDPPQGGPDPRAYTESVVKLSPALAPMASFKDRIAGGDEDLSTGNPVLLPGGLVFAVGKTDVGFFLRQSDLSQVGAVRGVCGSDPDGGPAYDPATQKLFVPCQDGGVQVIDVAARRLGPRLGGANGAPMVAGGDVWALRYPAGTLVEYDAATGATRQTVKVGSSVASFTSPSAADGRILVPTTTGVTALGV